MLLSHIYRLSNLNQTFFKKIHLGPKVKFNKTATIIESEDKDTDACVTGLKKIESPA